MNDSENTGTVWLRVDQLAGGVMVCVGFWQGELQSVGDCHIVNDPENTGNVWLRVDQLGRTVKCLTEDNTKLLDEKNILIKVCHPVPKPTGAVL